MKMKKKEAGGVDSYVIIVYVNKRSEWTNYVGIWIFDLAWNKQEDWREIPKLFILNPSELVEPKPRETFYNYNACVCIYIALNKSFIAVKHTWDN